MGSEHRNRADLLNRLRVYLKKIEQKADAGEAEAVAIDARLALRLIEESGLAG